MRAAKLTEPTHLRLPLEPPLGLEVLLCRGLEQRLGLGHRTRDVCRERLGEVCHRRLQPVGRYGGERQPDGHRLLGPDHPGGRADLQRSLVANRLDQRLCSRQVGHQAQRGLLHRELGVLGDHPQVAAERQLEPRADGVALHRRDADEPRVAQPREPLLVAVDRLADRLVVELHQPCDVTRRRVEHRPVQPRAEALPRSPDHHDPRRVGQLLPDRRQRVPHRRRLRVAHLRPAQRHRRHRVADVEVQPRGGDLVGTQGHARSVGGATDAHRQASATRSA